MQQNNPYASPSATAYNDPAQRVWQDGVESSLAERGVLQRRVIVRKPVAVTIEYFARGLRDRILVDGKTAVSIIPVFRFRDRFEFQIPFSDGVLPATVSLKIGRFLKLAWFEICINSIPVYREEDGHTTIGTTALVGDTP